MQSINVNNQKELVRKLKKGDINAFNDFFYEYSSKLYHFAYGYLKSKEESEELVQEVFFKIWEKRNDIKEEYQFSSYLFSIAFNYIKKYFRSKALLNRYFELSPLSEDERIVEEDVNYSSLKELIDTYVDKMPPKRRTVFIKSRFEGKNAKDISKEMEISQSTVENHLSQALKFLREQLKDENLALLLYFCLFIQ
ncbi:RNA polymerase sigma-70 factor [Sunxiuqinia sp. A32]|uniref:RNA polymerase sigma-70 factor n=1 Tax=Sunxiuqinia sp. A32 TaxID=3461496 RepID=UPI0040462D2B